MTAPSGETHRAAIDENMIAPLPHDVHAALFKCPGARRHRGFPQTGGPIGAQRPDDFVQRADGAIGQGFVRQGRPGKANQIPVIAYDLSAEGQEAPVIGIPPKGR